MDVAEAHAGICSLDHGPLLIAIVMAKVRDRLVAFLASQPGRAVCAACLGRALDIPEKRAHESSVRLEADPRLARRHGECSACAKPRIVILFHPPRISPASPGPADEV